MAFECKSNRPRPRGRIYEARNLLFDLVVPGALDLLLPSTCNILSPAHYLKFCHVPFNQLQHESNSFFSVSWILLSSLITEEVQDNRSLTVI